MFCQSSEPLASSVWTRHCSLVSINFPQGRPVRSWNIPLTFAHSFETTSGHVTNQKAVSGPRPALFFPPSLLAWPWKTNGSSWPSWHVSQHALNMFTCADYWSRRLQGIIVLPIFSEMKSIKAAQSPSLLLIISDQQFILAYSQPIVSSFTSQPLTIDS
jgi:hypothetical protein